MSSHSENIYRKPAMKAPRSRKAPQSDEKEVKKPSPKKLLEKESEKFDNYVNSPSAQEFIQQETSKRLQQYFPAKHILAISKIGESFSDMVGNFILPKYNDFELGYGLEFCEPTFRKHEKNQLKIGKKILNEETGGILTDDYQALLMWEDEKFRKTLYICPLSCLDTRHAFLLMFDCQRLNGLEQWVILNNAIDYYNRFYEPKIFIEQLQSLKQIYDTTVVQGRKSNYSIIKNNNVCARFITPKEKCLVFDDGEHIEILKEKEVTDNPFYKVRKGIYEKTKVKEIQTDLENIELLKYDYSRKHVGK